MYAARYREKSKDDCPSFKNSFLNILQGNKQYCIYRVKCKLAHFKYVCLCRREEFLLAKS